MRDWSGLNEAAPYAWTGGAGVVGRLMYHARQVQRGKRKPIGWALLLDLPIAFGMGWGAYGVCVWAGLGSEPTVSAAIAVSYLGPYSIDRLFGRLADKYFGADTFNEAERGEA